MNEIIIVAERQIGGEAVQTVNARDLHAFLVSKQDFSTWIKARVDQYGFCDGRDFTLHKFVDGRATVIDYYLTLDMAKELAMVERNEKGKQARQYFIECERRAKSGAIDINAVMSDPATLRTALLAYTEKVMTLEAKVQEQTPKVQFHDAVADAINCQSVQEIAKVLRTGPNRLFQFLREAGVLMRNNLPYQQYIDAGHFRVVEGQYLDHQGESRTYARTLVTGKGLTFIQRRMANQGSAMA